MKTNHVASYSGSDPYAFISYAHKDWVNVAPVLSSFKENGIRFWYDEGIRVGDDWANKIGVSLSKASHLILFLSKSSVKSKNVQREISFAIQNNLPVLCIQIGRFNLPDNLKLQLEVYQKAILLKSRYGSYSNFTRSILPILSQSLVVSPVESVSKDEPIRIRKTGFGGKLIGLIILLCLLAIILPRIIFADVPEVRGLTPDVAKQRIEEAGFRCNIAMDYNDDVSFGLIASQSAKGKTLKIIQVLITESIGPNSDLVTVPETVGFQISDGIAKLIDVGMFSFTVAPVQSDTYAHSYIALQSIPAGINVSSKNIMDLSVASTGQSITFVYNGRSYTISGDGKTQISLQEDGSILTELITNRSIDISQNSSTFLNPEKTISANVDLNVGLTNQGTSPSGVYSGAIHLNIILENEESNLAWNTIQQLSGGENGQVAICADIDPFIVETVPYDESTYISFVEHATGKKGTATSFNNPISMYLGNSITLSDSSTIGPVLQTLLNNADLFNVSLPTISGDQLYQDYSLIIQQDGSAYLTLYGELGGQKTWFVSGSLTEEAA